MRISYYRFKRNPKLEKNKKNHKIEVHIINKMVTFVALNT